LHNAPDPVVALERARWLDELRQAIAQAQRLAWRLGVAEGDLEEARDLYTRLETVRAELEALRTTGWVGVRQEVDSSWLKSILPNSRLTPFHNGDSGT
jgi:hypothetical protein